MDGLKRLEYRGYDSAGIALFEPGTPGLGVAYATDRPEHLLNVPSGRMSAFPDRADDFLDWLAAQPGFVDVPRATLAGAFAPRREYAAYLRERLGQASQASPASLEIMPRRVTGLRRDPADPPLPPGGREATLAAAQGGGQR